MKCDICLKEHCGIAIHNVYNFGEKLSINPPSTWVRICFDCEKTSPCSGKWWGGVLTCPHGHRWKIVTWWENNIANMRWEKQSPKWYSFIISLFSKCGAKE